MGFETNNVTTEDLLLNGVTSTPAILTDGCLWYRSDLKGFYGYIDGVVQKIAIVTAKEWMPNSIPLGSVLTLGATYFINGGAGVYLSFSGSADDAIFYNDSLSKSGSLYDGSDLAVKLHCRLSTNPNVGDVIAINVSYAITKNGDNTSTLVTVLPQQDELIDGNLQDIEFDIVLGTMVGVVGGETFMFTMEVNGTGAGQGSYTGNLEVIAMELIKL